MRHPHVVRKLVLASVMTSRAGTDPEFWEGFEHATLEQMPAELKEAYRATAPHPEALQSFFDKSVQRMRAFQDVADAALRAIQAPTLVVIGDRDIVRPEHAVETFRTLPHAELAVLPGTDHMQMVERAEWLVSMVEAFLDAPMAR
jgi:pimeloyl-ACP methyl ester carboxylesterase